MTPPLLRRPGPWIALLAVALALLFLGGRGIWDPDEGRYTNVALNMLASGDWLNPRRSEDIGHWTKPPLTYWAIAASIATFGQNAFAARLPAALSYLLCVALAGWIARRLGVARASSASAVYATMLLPFGAAQLITTDYLLAAWSTLAMAAFVEARFGTSKHPSKWIALMWLALALAFMTKGPPGLLPLLPIIAFDRLMPARERHRLFDAAGIALFALVALPWYVAVIHGNPGLLQYFLGEEVVGRIASNEFRRHGEWYGWLQVYAPTLLIGTLPWTPALWRWLRGLPARVRTWREPSAREAARGEVLLALWLALPLLVFCVSRSRLPLYLLPLFSTLAVLAAMQFARERRPLPRWPLFVAWAVLLLALKAATTFWPTHKNAADWAEQIRARVDGPVRELIFVQDMARYGLHLHLDRGVDIEKISLDRLEDPKFVPDWDEPLIEELHDFGDGAVWICKQADWPRVRARIEGHGFVATPLGAPYQRRVIFGVSRRPAAPAGAPHAPPPR